jgi:hypothetical protein
MSIFGSASQSDLGPWFLARFDSDCAECLTIILEGDEARYKDGEVVCESCGNNGGTDRGETICPKCFVALSASEQQAGRATHEEC